MPAEVQELSIEQIQSLHAKWSASLERLNDARHLVTDGKIEAAARECRAILRDDPEYAVAHFQYGLILLRMNRPREAVEQLLLSIEQGLDHPSALSHAREGLDALSGSGGRGIGALRRRLEAADAPHEPTVSLAMIAKDEEEHLARCLRSIRDVVSQIVLVDTGSSDATVQIAEEFGADIYEFAWCDDFSAARNEALRHATGDWILSLDADEELTPESVTPLRELLHDPNVIGANLRIDNEMGGYVMSFRTIRLWRNHRTVRYVQPVHEQVLWAVRALGFRMGRKIVDPSDVIIRHYGYERGTTTVARKEGRNLQILRRMVEEEPDNAHGMFYYANALSGDGNNEEALRIYEQWEPRAMEQPPINVYWVRMGFTDYARILNTVGRHQEAYDLTTRAIDRFGPTVSLRYQRALALRRLGRTEEALAEFEAAESMPRTVTGSVELVESHPHLMPLLGAELYLAVGNQERARELFERTIHFAPDDSTARQGLALLLISQGKLNEAEPHLERVLELDPDNLQVLVPFAQIQLFRRDYDRAIDLLRRATSHDPSGEAARLLGEVQLIRGEPKAAAETWSRCSRPEIVAGPLAFLQLAEGRAEAMEALQDPDTQKGFRALVDKLLVVQSRGPIPATATLLDVARVAGSDARLRPLRGELLRLFLKHRFQEGIALLRTRPAR